MREFETGFDYGRSAAAADRERTVMTARGGRQRSGLGVSVRRRRR